MRVLAFGHLPTAVGGRQSSGLANVIYQLALHISRCKEVDLSLAATDIFEAERDIRGLRVLGWTKGILLWHVLKHPFSTIRILANTISAKRKYKTLVSLPGLMSKSVFLDYALRKVKPDIIHLHGANSILYFPIVPRSCKLIVTLHGNVGNDDNLPNRSIHEKMERVCCKSNRVSAICTISTRIPEILRSMYGEIVAPVKVILNAYDRNVFFDITPVAHEKLTFCTIASFSRLKGQERVLDALIASKIPCRYVCVGHFPDSDRGRLEKKAKEAYVDFLCLGVKKPWEIREILATCDYMILPSSSEGFGLVYIESIACGVPVIIPRNLPLALEGDILNDCNSIKINDCSTDSIVAILPDLKDKVFDHRKVSATVIGYTWDNIATEYVDLFHSLTL